MNAIWRTAATAAVRHFFELVIGSRAAGLAFSSQPL